jgi:predicted HTH transcriptional regulator
MPAPKQYSGISKRAKTLLKSGETREVDYKENTRGLHAEDLVAFANSPSGGAILLGVEECQPARNMDHRPESNFDQVKTAI